MKILTCIKGPHAKPYQMLEICLEMQLNSTEFFQRIYLFDYSVDLFNGAVLLSKSKLVLWYYDLFF